MNLVQAVILSFVQGISEFLPISSKGHLNIFQYFLGLEPSLSFDIFLNTATLFSVIFFFRKKVPYFVKNLPYIIVGSIPAVIVGFFLKHKLEFIFSNIHLLPYFFLVTTAFLLSTKYFKQKDEKINYFRAFFIGFIQSFALFPGISRSGSTIFAGLLAGLSSEEAFNFSFSLFIPASIGALLLDFKDIYSNESFVSPNYLICFFLTFVIGLASINLLKKVLVGRKFWYFAVYTFALSIALFVLTR
jgi:undecaprenyl-diphosphatase